MLSKFKKFNVQTVYVLAYKKRNACKIFYLCTELITSYSDIDKEFIFMNEGNVTKIKNYAYEDWIILDVVINHSIKIFEC